MRNLLVAAVLAVSGAAVAAGAQVGAAAPDFALMDLDGKKVQLADFKGKTVVLEWFNPECPYVKSAHTRGPLVDAAKKSTAKGVVWLSVNSGAPGKQGAGLEKNKQAVKAFGMTNAVLLDASGATGKAYGATNTPHLFIVDKEGKLAFRGGPDNSPDGEGKSPVGGTLVNHLDAALEDLEAGRPVKTPETRAYGCGVKYGS